MTSTTTVTNPAPPPPPTTPPPAPTTPPTRTPALAPNAAAYNKYVEDLTADGVRYRSRSDLITIGMNICQALREGSDPETAINAATSDTSYYRHKAGYIIGSASHNLCPDQEPIVDAWSNSP